MKNKEIPILQPEGSNIPLFLPHIPVGLAEEIAKVLETRWIGQGPRVELFEEEFLNRFCPDGAGIAVGSGTDALHLAYLLAGVGPGDEVITPVFTCTATNIPLLYIGAKPIFVDVDPKTMNIDLAHLHSLVGPRTRAVAFVDYGGLPNNIEAIRRITVPLGIPIIEDAAHSLGATYRGQAVGRLSDFTIFSFQAIKHITTGDGGFLTFLDKDLLKKARRLRWFGIERSDKQKGIWDNDIVEIGYKYQMTDIAAAMGLAGLRDLDNVLSVRRNNMRRYISNLTDYKELRIIGDENPDFNHAAWLFSIAVGRRMELQKKLYSHGIESNQVHYRNDRYSIFGGRRGNLPNMDRVEEEYLVLPLHTRMGLEEVDRVCDLILSGW